MNKDEARPIIAMLAGYWPTPQMAPEEVAAWVGELCSPLKIRPDEAQKVITDTAHSDADSSAFRLRPGQLVSGVQALRRKRALETSSRALIEAPYDRPDPDEMEAFLTAARAACEAGMAANAERVRRVREKSAK